MRRLFPGWSVAVWAATGLVFFPVLFLGETLGLRDALRFTLPARQHFVDSVWAGRIPEWFDGVSFGVAFAANPVHLVSSPQGWANALFPWPAGFDFLTVLWVALAALGVAALARRLGAAAAGAAFAGVSFVSSGYVTSVVSNGMAPHLTWAPWVAWAAEGLAAKPTTRRGATLAAFLALQALTGEPASVLIATLLAAVFVFTRARRGDDRSDEVQGFAPGRASLRHLAILGAALAFGLVLACAAVLPGLALLQDSARAAGLGGAPQWSMHPGRLLELVWPHAFGIEATDTWYAGLALKGAPGDPFWSFSLFVGLPTLLLAGLSLVRTDMRWLLGSSLGFVGLAMGTYTPLFHALEAVGLAGIVNFPEKYIYGALVLWCAAAGTGLTCFSAGRGRRLPQVALAFAAMLLLVVAALWLRSEAVVADLSTKARGWALSLSVVDGVAHARWFGALAGASAVTSAVAAWLRWSRRPALAQPLLWGAAVAPSLLAAWAGLATVPRELATSTPRAAVASRIRPIEEGRPRLLRLPGGTTAGHSAAHAQAEATMTTLEDNVGARFGLDVLPGFDSGETARSRRFWLKVAAQQNLTAFSKLVGVETILAPHADRLAPQLELIERITPAWGLFRAPPGRPRAFAAPRWVSMATSEAALKAVALPSHEQDLGAVAIEGPVLPGPLGQGPLTPCRVHILAPERVELDCDAPQRGYAVLLELAAPGWSATVDGQPAELVVADGLFRATALPHGRHQVVFSYRTPWLRVGALMSALGWLGWALIMTRRRGSAE